MPAPPTAATTNAPPDHAKPPAGVANDDDHSAQRALPVTDDGNGAPTNQPTAEAPVPDDIPVAKIARPEDLDGTNAAPSPVALPVTNAAPLIGPPPPTTAP